MPNANSRPRKDAVFNLDTPLLFAHRGGAGEVPESTKRAFKHAIEKKSDVLELDVSLTADGEMVVWHGPELDNVYGNDGKRMTGKIIGDAHWKNDLMGKARVLSPRYDDDKDPPKDPPDDLLLMTLDDFFKFVAELDGLYTHHPSKIPLNIEIKETQGKAKSWDKENNFVKFLDLVDSGGKGRKIILASATPDLVEGLREHMHGRKKYPTNLSWAEQLAFGSDMAPGSFELIKLLAFFADVVASETSLADRAFETTYAVCTQKLVNRVHSEERPIYAYLTGSGKTPIFKIPIAPAIDDQSDKKLKSELDRLVGMGVDGIMTDYPEKVGQMLGK